MIRLRRGNVPRLGMVVRGELADHGPAAVRRSRRTRPRWAAGYSRSWPPPITATVGVPASTAATCAAASMPSARPDTIVAPSARDRVGDPRRRRAPRLRRAPRPDDRDGPRPVERRRRRPARTGRAAAARSAAAGRGTRDRRGCSISTPARRTGPRIASGSFAACTIARAVAGASDAPPSASATASTSDRPPRRRPPRRRENRRRAAERRRPAARTTPAPRLAASPRTTQASRSAVIAHRLGTLRDAPRPFVRRRHVRAAWPVPADARASAGPLEREAVAGARKRAASSRCLGAHGRRLVEVRDRAGDPQQAVRAPTGQALPFREHDRPGDRRRRPSRTRAGAGGPDTRPFGRRPFRAAWRVRAAAIRRRDGRRRLRQRRPRRGPPARPGRRPPTGRSGRGAGPRPGAGSGPGRPAGSCRHDRPIPAGRRGTGSSPRRT